MLSPLLSALLVLVLAFKKISSRLHTRAQSRRHGCLPPPQERHLDPILGSDALRKSVTAVREHRLLTYMQSRFREMGYTFESRTLRNEVLHTADPKNLQAILATNAKDFSIGKRRMTAFRPLLGHGIFAADGKQWEKSRGLLRPSFTRDNIADLDIFERHVCQLLTWIPADGKTVNLQDLFFRMTIDSATDFLFGQTVGTLQTERSPVATQFSHDYHKAQDGVITRARLGSLIHLQPSFKREFKRAVAGSRAYVHRFVQEAVQARNTPCEKKVQPPDCFLTQLVELTSNETEITDQLLNVLLAGRDTTAGLLSIQFHILARRPDVWAKVREDVSSLGGRQPSFRELRDLKYVSWVINETLRLYPIIPRNLRKAVNDTVLPTGGGPDGQSPIFVSKGMNVTFDVYTLHRRPDLYGPDAEEFKPERWETLRPGWAYLPFGGGPRKCIGQQFALTQVAYTTVRLAQRFERLESRDPRPYEEELTITLASRHGAQVGCFAA
ncbi:cytochrome protein [Aspergillus sclerotiicarbonarius CBS 121057]|uniref:Cytochrome protein n=1 Tax=Aspergillus sclerotiicarbonarius (strain CBS 121057 / IBT 28362) TaxID=1448318 RepID=A0A319DRJ2_ASPSB|nr:cytochrome protein [Aspergillus sclerotiicarbonarius CBS 121057]